MKEWDPSKPNTPELEALIHLKYEECEDVNGKFLTCQNLNFQFKILAYHFKQLKFCC